jgi:hypothetical protein
MRFVGPAKHDFSAFSDPPAARRPQQWFSLAKMPHCVWDDKYSKCHFERQREIFLDTKADYDHG